MTRAVPLFPLHTVLCPGIALPLHIFEERYRAMIGRCLERSEPFGVVLIRDGREVGPLAGHVADVGTLAAIRQVSRYADGRMDVVTVGTTRFRVTGLETGREPWLTGIVDDLPEPLGGDPAGAAELAERTGRRFLAYLERIQGSASRVDLGRAADAEVPDEPEVEGEDPDEALDPAGTESGKAVDDGVRGDALRRAILLASARRLIAEGDPTAVSWLLTGLVALDLPARQALLEVPDTVTRLQRLERHLDREMTLLGRGLRPLAVETDHLALRRN